jgi:hypothetical protein
MSFTRMSYPTLICLEAYVEVASLHELYPSQWKKIASLMDRSRDECQLRYLDRIIPQRHGTTGEALLSTKERALIVFVLERALDTR